MKEQLNKILSTFSDFWKAQEKKRKITYIVVLASVVLIAIILTIVLNVKRYVVLYDGLEATEAAEIVTQIDTLGIEANLSGDGKISVPEDQENSLRMQLGTMGYPKSSLSYDVWNNNVDMFTTDYEKREQAKMQLQERLIATIKTLKGVESAIVTLNIPEQKDTVINVNAKPSSASVVLHLKNDVKLTDKQMTGIRYIVMKAVSGLTEENVTIVDGSGNLLVEGEESEDDVTVERNKLLFKQQYQETIKQEVLAQLIPAYGEDGVSVAVNANLNYDAKVSENTSYTPSHDDGSGMIQQNDKSNASGTNGATGGVVGVEPNADGTYPTGTEDGTGAYSNSEDSTSYLVNTLKEQIEKQGFSIEGLTVSVMVYTDDLPDEDKTTLLSNVASAAGTNQEFVSIGNLPKFGESAIIDTSTTYPFGFTRQQFIAFIAGLLALILFFTILYVIFANRAKKKRRIIDRQILAASQKAGDNGQVSGYFNTGEDNDIASLSEVPEFESKENAVRREIGEFAHNSPEIVAQLLKSWLREESDNIGGSSSSSGGRGGRSSRK